ncbi:TenA family transcriptional regulator [soil metagenome]
MEQPQNFTQELNDTILKNSLLEHPFYKKWNEGTLTKEELQQYAKQYYHFVKHFPRFVSSVHSNCDDAAIRKTLVENLADEEGYKTGISDHPELWLNFAEGLGLSREEVRSAEPITEVNELVEGMYDLTKDENYLKGLSALYAYEMQVPEISKTKISGLKNFYDLDDKKSIEFFAVHEEADVYHSKDELDIILSKIKSEDDSKNTIEAAKRSSELMWRFLDGVYNNYCMN